ncbi:MAG: DUF4235 domain-containing protein [Actinomycetaceae bacterium]|nr:DUF4235 domain-containing protein [Actinomycetaceae bacterium]
MNVPYKVASAGALAVSGIIANQVVDKGWKAVTGHESPQGQDEDNAAIVELLVFAVVSGVLVSLARRYALRGTKKFFGNSI